MHTFLVVYKDTIFFKDVMQLLHGDTMVPSAYPRNCDLCFSRKSSANTKKKMTKTHKKMTKTCACVS